MPTTDIDIQRVAVLGAGSMGHGITEVTAMAGFEVTMRDVEEDLVADGLSEIEWSLDKLAEKDRLDEDPDAILSRIGTTTDLAAAVGDADLVIEAVPERMDIKREVFGEIDDHAPPDAVLASNTSSLSITEIASATDRPEQVVGTHFFNPVVKMDLVEVIYGAETSDETAETAYGFVEAIGKTPIYVRKDVRGFVVNSVLGPFMDEAAWMVSAGEAGIKAADAAMVHRRGYPMGPFELADLTGIDIGHDVREEAGKEIPPIMAERVEAGDLGRKTGKGYYDYEDGDGPAYEPGDGEDFDTLRIEARMANEAARLIGNDVATAEAIDTGMRLGAGFPEGICRRADKIGLDVILDKLETLAEETGADRYEPTAYLRELVESGHTGEDAGAGFFEYDGGDGPGEYTYLNWDLDDRGVLAIELDRPDRLNALSEDLVAELVDVLHSVDVEDVRCVTIEGAGDRAFCAGADIGGFSALSPTDAMESRPVFQVLQEYDRPTIALIDGYCLGGGLEIALSCDLRIATEGSTFGQPEIDLGLIPGGGGTQKLLRIIGETRAKELVFRGNHISADRAADWGIINRAVPSEAFDDVAEDFISDIAEGPPVGLKVAKRVMNHGQNASLEAALEMESQGFGLLMSTDDVLEGTAAFMEDREPEFEGH